MHGTRRYIATGQYTEGDIGLIYQDLGWAASEMCRRVRLILLHLLAR